MKRQRVKFPWDLYWENKIYKLKRFIPMFSNVLVHVAVKNASNRLVGRLLIYAFSMTTKTHFLHKSGQGLRISVSIPILLFITN